MQTIVVDNTPGEEDAEYIRAHFPEIYLIKTGENLGFGKANNIAMRYALDNGCDYVFLLNQDTWIVDYDMFERLIAISNINVNYGILSPIHLRKDERHIGMMFELGNNYCSNSLLSDLYANELKDIYNTNYINAAGWLLPRRTLEIIGGFDPIYQHYEEDDDYINRVLFHGLKIGLCPKIRMVHDHSSIILPFSNNRGEYHRRQNLIVELTNPNNYNAFCNYYINSIKKFLRNVVFMRYSLIVCQVKDFFFVIKNHNRIAKSRSVNKKRGCSWL